MQGTSQNKPASLLSPKLAATFKVVVYDCTRRELLAAQATKLSYPQALQIEGQAATLAVRHQQTPIDGLGNS
jgi:hypothetical protein